MLIAIQALNNIITHRLLIACCGVPSNSYHHQTTKNFEKLLDQESIEKTLKITISILLIFRMNIGLTRLLKDSASNTEFDADGRFRLESTGLN